MKTVCAGMVEAGKFVPGNPVAFRNAFAFHEGKAVVLTVSRVTKKRSNLQNAYYRGLVVPMIARAMGEDDLDAVHDYLKAEFNFKYIIIGDKEIKMPQSTTKKTTVEFIEYIERVQRWAAEFLSLYIPSPNEMEIK